MNLIRLLVLLGAGLFIFSQSSVINAQSLSFSIEDELQNTVKIPKAVMDTLQSHPVVKEFAGDKKEVFDGFEAVPVDLNKDGKNDLIIRNIVLNGANTGPWWVFVKGSNGYRLALFVTSLNITVKKHRTKGYRDITTAIATATSSSEDRYVWNGKRYRVKS